MAQEKNSNIQKTKGKPVLKLLVFLGICCFLQFFVVAAIAVVRGYSTESKVSDVICFVGFFLILPYFRRQRRATVGLYFICIWIIFTSLVGLSHGGNLKKGNEYYSQGQYPEALQSCKKESQTWYHLLRYNYHERSAMEMMAKTYCQLEDFDNARDIYKLMITRYSGFYSQRAEDNLKRLKKGLLEVAKYSGQVPEGLEDVWKWYDLANIYRGDLVCYTKELEVYRQIIDMNVSEKCKELARKQIAEMTTSSGKYKGTGEF